MKKSTLKIFFVLLIATICVVALCACVPPPASVSYTGITLQNADGPVTSITLTEGEKIVYSQYEMYIKVSDGTVLSMLLTEGSFSPSELNELYSLKGGTTKAMTITYQNEGKVAHMLLDVIIKKPVVEVVTYTLSYQLKGDAFVKYLFDPVGGLTRILSVPETHPDMKNYQKITWYTSADCSISHKLETPYEMSSDLTLYGIVRDDRSYTVRFWKEDSYTNQIGSDVRVGYNGRVDLPKDGIAKEGYNFERWMKGANALAPIFGAYPTQYINIADECTAYPAEQIINIYAKYALKTYDIGFWYLDSAANLQKMTIDGKTSVQTKHGSSLKIGAALQVSATEVTLPSPNLVAGYTGLWYINDQPVGQDYTTTVQSDMQIVAKYTPQKLTVTFMRFNGTMIGNAFELNYNQKIPADIIPQLLTDEGYTYRWDNEAALNQNVTTNMVFQEVQTPKIFSYQFLDTDNVTVLKQENASPFNSDIALLTTEQIAVLLGAKYKAYYKYGWYLTANIESDKPLQGTIKQPAAAVKFYLKYTDERKYTVNYYYTQEGDTANIYPAGAGGLPISTVTTFGKTVEYNSIAIPGKVVVGWVPKQIYAKNGAALGASISSSLAFTPSAVAVGEYTVPVVLDVVVMYSRESYTLNLYEPNFIAAGGETLVASPKVVYETVLSTLAEYQSYNTADRVKPNGTYRFYGWVDVNGDLVVPSEFKIITSINLYAKWVTLAEGTFGLTYQIYTDTGTAQKYARVVGYQGSAVELLIGSKYIENNVEYEVREIGKIVTKPAKNLTVKNIQIPSCVTSIQAGAFLNFYSASEYRVDAGSASYKTTAGVLYNSSATTLVAYPFKKVGEFQMPSSVINVLEAAFSNYSAARIDLGSALQTIGAEAFYNAQNLTSVALPSTLLSIGQGAFRGCYNLSTVTFSGTNLTKIGQYAFDGTPFEATMTGGVVLLGNYLVRGGAGIAANYTLSDTILGVADGAFCGTVLESFATGAASQLKWIGNSAFAECQNLIKFSILSTATTNLIAFGTGMFDGIPNTVFHIAVANQAVLDAYRASAVEYQNDFVLATP